MKNELDYGTIGVRVRAARKKLGLTQEELANRTELTVPYISNIENNHTKLSLVTITAIANALDTTIDSLMYDNLKVLTSKTSWTTARTTRRQSSWMSSSSSKSL